VKAIRHLAEHSRADRRLGAGLLVLVLLSLGFLSCGSEQGPTDRVPSALAHESVDQRQLAGFELFRTRPEGLPSEVRKFLTKPGYPMQWGMAQLLPVRLKGKFWLVPGAGHLCLVVENEPIAGRFCATTKNVLKHGVSAVFLRAPGTPWFGTPGRRLIVGVAPEGVRDVLILTDGKKGHAWVRSHGIFTLSDSVNDPPREILLR
jgi:hypothetical protein